MIHGGMGHAGRLQLALRLPGKGKMMNDSTGDGADKFAALDAEMALRLGALKFPTTPCNRLAPVLTGVFALELSRMVAPDADSAPSDSSEGVE